MCILFSALFLFSALVANKRTYKHVDLHWCILRSWLFRWQHVQTIISS